MVYSIAWDETAVSDDTYGYDLDTKINNNLIAVRERLAEEHRSPSGGSGLAYLMHEWNVTSKSTGSPYTALETDHIILITTGASAYTVNLPTAAGITGKPYKIIKVDSGAGAVTVDGSGSETINGSATITLSNQYDCLAIVSDGTNWVKDGGSAIGLDWDTCWTDAVHTHQSDAEGGLITGSLLQEVTTLYTTCTTGTTAIPYDDTIPQNTEGDEYFTRTITPKSATSKLKIEAVVHLATSQAGGLLMVLALFQDSIANALAVSGVKSESSGNVVCVTLIYEMVSGTTSEITFKVRCGGASGTTTINGTGGARKYGGVWTSSITIREVMA